MSDHDPLSVIEQELSFDAWRFFEDEGKHAIPPDVVWGLASAMLAEFIKGTGLLGDLGKSTRDTLEELVRRLRQRDAFENYVAEPYLKRQAVPELKRLSSLPLTLEQKAAGAEGLSSALQSFGLSERQSKLRATRIADQIATIGR